MGPVNLNERGAHGAPLYQSARGVLSHLEDALVLVSAASILVMGTYVFSGIVLRTFFGTAIYDEVPIIGELMVASVSLTLASVAAHRGFIAVELFTGRLSRRAQIWLDVLATFVGFVAVVPISISAYLTWHDAWFGGSYYAGVLGVPEWPGHFVFMIGLIMFLVRLIDLAVFDILRGAGVISDAVEKEETT